MVGEDTVEIPKGPSRNLANDEYDGSITVDFEDWRCALSPGRNPDYRTRPAIDVEYLRQAADSLLGEFDRTGTKGTFFVLGEVALAAPEVVKEISRRGHEVASHSPIHLPPGMIPRDEYRKLVARDFELLGEITGTKPMGFRVPYLSVHRGDGWLLRLLADVGFVYDSSVAPTWTPFWGIPSAPKAAYHPDLDDISVPSQKPSILEIPLTVWPSWRAMPGLPVAGGFYMRMWPNRLLVQMLRNNVNRGHPLNLYIHPGNLEREKEKIRNPTLRDRLSQYAGMAHGLQSFRTIMSSFRFAPLSRVHSERLRVPENP